MVVWAYSKPVGVGERIAGSAFWHSSFPQHYSGNSIPAFRFFVGSFNLYLIDNIVFKYTINLYRKFAKNYIGIALGVQKQFYLYI